ncbi:hypothetical protein PVAR5_6654 [Paecilomyces variotii No. 5]|uniref:Uncharacterized protein n=1 Tax=Byssochlamys spectabilis (strain No. 5 / NBRC 109023) TaxID=1356009 RepID=V5G7J2_BYSSN|nr:hypothetical protein PVAR5_6654 [Paecilomyces variotii No. 5]
MAVGEPDLDNNTHGDKNVTGRAEEIGPWGRGEKRRDGLIELGTERRGQTVDEKRKKKHSWRWQTRARLGSKARRNGHGGQKTACSKLGWRWSRDDAGQQVGPRPDCGWVPASPAKARGDRRYLWALRSQADLTAPKPGSAAGRPSAGRKDDGEPAQTLAFPPIRASGRRAWSEIFARRRWPGDLPGWGRM